MKKFNFHRRAKRRVPLLNTTATADISFMLLVFFLVTSSMDSDKGLTRNLPPKSDAPTEELVDIQREDILQLHIKSDGNVEADGENIVKDSISECVASFVEARGPLASKAIVEIESDSTAEYGTYFKVQNEIVRGYAIARGKYAMKRYKKPYKQLADDEKDQVRKYYPQRISER